MCVCSVCSPGSLLSPEEEDARRAVMSALREQQCYGLSSGKLSRGGDNISVFHVKLTDSAARAIGSYQTCKVGSHTHTHLCLSGRLFLSVAL